MEPTALTDSDVEGNVLPSKDLAHENVKAMAKKLVRSREPVHTRRRSGRKALDSILVLAALILGFFIWRSTRPLPVEVTIVSYQRAGAAASPVLRQSGYVTFPRSVTVGGASAGAVEEIHFEEGDRVKKGDILATLETGDLTAQQRVHEAALQDARQTLVRTRNLHAAGAASAIDLQQAETALATAQAELDLVNAHIESTRIRAPFDGRMLEKLAEVGARISGGVGVLVDDSKTLVEIDFSQEDLSLIKTDQPAIVVLDAYPETEYAARLIRLSPTANRTTNTIHADIEILKPDARIIPNMSARVYLVEEAREQNMPVQTVLAVDRTAIFENGRAVQVWLVEDNRVRIRDIETGALLGDDYVEISGGLKRDDIVVKQPSTLKLKEGQRVAVIH